VDKEEGSPVAESPESAGSLREYEVVFDLVEHTCRLVGVEDCYGVPVPAGRTDPATIAEKVHPDDVDAFAEAMADMTRMARGERIGWEMRMRHANGNYVRSQFVAQSGSYSLNGKVSKALIRVRWLAFE
jgi:hypothetical protein